MSFKCKKCGKILSFIDNFLRGGFCAECERREEVRLTECDKMEKARMAECKKMEEDNGKLIFENSRNAQFKLSVRCPNCSSDEKANLPDLKTGGFSPFFLYILPPDILFVRKFKCAKCGYLWCLPRSIVTLLAIVFLAVICTGAWILFAECARNEFKHMTSKTAQYGNNNKGEKKLPWGEALLLAIYAWPIVLFVSVIISACRVMSLHTKPKSLIE